MYLWICVVVVGGFLVIGGFIDGVDLIVILVVLIDCDGVVVDLGYFI